MNGFDRNLAVVIGINDYRNGIAPLHTAVADAIAIAKILKDTYKYTLVNPDSDSEAIFNQYATKDKLKTLLTDYLPNKINPTKRDRLIFYFAGHGIEPKNNEQPGYLVTHQKDCKQLSDSLLSMDNLHGWLSELQCKHLLVILDCCFAGAFRWSSYRKFVLDEDITEAHYNRFVRSNAWQVITSASHNQQAFDFINNRDRDIKQSSKKSHSPFAQGLIEALQNGKGDRNQDGIVIATELYLYIRDYLYQKAGEKQTPGLFPLKKHDRGEYIFRLPNTPLNLKKTPELNPKNNPYRGLKTFEAEHAKLFFGRDELIKELVERLSALEHRFTIILGASGSGKSSLVKAGLIPQLLKTQENKWLILKPIRPGEDPLASLYRAIEEIVFDSKDTFSTNPDVAIDIINTWSQKNHLTKLLLVIDQFEELVTLAHQTDANYQLENSQTWQPFLQLLANILENCPQFHLIVTLRSDFETRFLDSALSPYWSKGRFPVRPMRSDELRETIERPALEKALYFEPPNLVDRLIDEVGQMPGALPLLSFTLSELYIQLYDRWRKEGKDDRTLTIDEEFERKGGVAGSLTTQADRAYSNLEDEKLQTTMRRVILRMLTVEGWEVARRQVSDSELLYPDRAENERVKTIIDCLINTRLIVKEQGEKEAYIEPAHDYLVRGWNKLQDWIKDDREDLALQQSLTPAANDWVRNGKLKDDFLLPDGERLNRLETILNQENNWFNQREFNFVKASLDKRNLENQRAKERLSGQIEALISYGKGLIIEDRKFEALIEYLRAGIALKEAKKTYNLQVSKEMELLLMLHQLTNGWQESNRLEDHRAEIPSINFSPDGKILASASWDGTVKIWNLNGSLRKTLRHSNTKDFNPINSVSVSPDNDLIASADDNGIIHLWKIDGSFLRSIKTSNREIQDLIFNPNHREILAIGNSTGNIEFWNIDGSHIRTIEGHKKLITSIAFSPDGNMIASASDDSTIKLWNLDGSSLETLSGHQDSVKKVSFSADGKIIASASLDNTVKLWESSGKLIDTLEGHTDSVWGINFSADNKIIASAAQDNQIKLWNLDGSLIKTFSLEKEDAGGFWDIAFNPDGKTIAASHDTNITLWKNQNLLPIQLTEHKGTVVNIAFSPDSKTIATASSDNTVKLWKRDGSRLINTLEHEDSVESVNFSSNGKTIATATQDNKVKIWNSNGRLLQTINAHNGEVFDVAFSPDDRLIASASGDNTVKLWKHDGTSWSLKKILKGHTSEVNSVSFSPDNKIIATASWDNTVKLWDLNGTLINSLDEHWRSVLDVVFSPDGTILASAGEDASIQLRRINDDQSTTPLNPIYVDCSSEKYNFPGRTRGLTGISFSLDSQLIAATCGDHTIKILLLDGTLLTTIEGHQESDFWGVNFSPDWQTLAAGSGDNTVTVWDLTLDNLLVRGCNIVRDYLENNPNVNDSDLNLCQGIDNFEAL